MDVIPDEPIVIASLLSLALLGILILNLAGRGSGMQIKRLTSLLILL
jgi:hypothetical protein